MHAFSDNYTLGKFNPPSYANWLAELRALFPIPDEFLLADAIFSFPTAFKEGKTPQQAYERFDTVVSAEAERERQPDVELRHGISGLSGQWPR